jgi:selenocysteine lyase/cysteine desulfurase
VDYLGSVGAASGAVEPEASAHASRRERLLGSMAAIAAYEAGLSRRFLSEVAGVPGVRVWGIAEPGRVTERTPTFALTFDRISPRAAAEALGRAGIFAWDGDFYAQGLIERLGLAEGGGVLRLGFVHYTTTDEVDRTVEAVSRLAAGAAIPA